MSGKTALLVGAGGLIGGFCLKELSADARYEKVVVLGRRKLPLEHPKLVQHVVDFGRRETFEALTKADDVFSCMGTTLAQSHDEESYYKVDFDIPYEVARFSVEQGASSFSIVSSVGADPKSKTFYLRLKGEIEAAVSKLPFNAVHIFRPSLLLGPRTEPRRFEGVLQAVGAASSVLLMGRLRAYKAVQGETVAKAMIAAARSEERGVHIHLYDSMLALARRAS